MKLSNFLLEQLTRASQCLLCLESKFRAESFSKQVNKNNLFVVLYFYIIIRLRTSQVVKVHYGYYLNIPQIIFKLEQKKGTVPPKSL